MFAMKSSLEDMDALELDFRMRLAEVQRRYKEKQRELVKLQRRRDSGDRHEDAHRSLARRGPGRPRKRTHTLSALSPPCKRGKSHSSSGKLSSKSLLTSDDYDLGAGIRKRHKGPEEEQEALMGMGKARSRNQSWDDHDSSSDFMSQLKIKKKDGKRPGAVGKQARQSPLPHKTRQAEVTLQVFRRPRGKTENRWGLWQVLDTV